MRPTINHTRCIERLQYELSNLPPGTPYAVDIASKRIKEPLSVGVYQSGTELQEIKNFLKSKNEKLYPNVEDIELFAKSKYFVISLRGIEISYGFGKDARRKAFLHAEQILRNRHVHVISAFRMSGIRKSLQIYTKLILNLNIKTNINLTI